MNTFHERHVYRLLSPISERLLSGLLAGNPTPGEYRRELTRLFTSGLFYILIYGLFGGLMRLVAALSLNASWSNSITETGTWCLITVQCWAIWYGLKTSFNLFRLYRFGLSQDQQTGRQWDAVASCSIVLAILMVALTNIPLQTLSIVTLLLIWCVTSVIPTAQIWSDDSGVNE